MGGKAKKMPNEEDGVVFWVWSERDTNWTHGSGNEHEGSDASSEVKEEQTGFTWRLNVLRFVKEKEGSIIMDILNLNKYVMT